jgi:predicted O-methyltransferase YrrM
MGKTEAERRVLAVLDEVLKSPEGWANVPPSDGRMLRLLVEAAGAKHVVEIGTSTGYSGLWLCLGLQATGGRLTTFEIDRARVAKAREYFKKAGVDSMVTVVEGDAHVNISRLKGPVDLVFIDANKEGYLDYLNKMLPLVSPGGLILAHNIDMVPDYMERLAGDPTLETVLYHEGAGLSITLKKR